TAVGGGSSRSQSSWRGSAASPRYLHRGCVGKAGAHQGWTTPRRGPAILACDELMKVNIADNEFIDCTDIIRLNGARLLSIGADPVSVTIVTPPDVPAGRVVNVVDGRKQTDAPQVTVVNHDGSSSVFWEGHLLAHAIKDHPDLIRAHVDLRPL